MAEQNQDDQLERTYSSYVRIRDVALKTCLRQWTTRKKWQVKVRDIRASSTTWWRWYIYIYIYDDIYAISTDIPDPFLPPLPIVHCFRQVPWATPRIFTELLYVGSSWSPCFARPCEGVRRSASLMSSSPVLQQCPAYLVSLMLIVFVMGGGSRITTTLWGVPTRNCSILLAAFLCSCCQVFSPSV